MSIAISNSLKGDGRIIVVLQSFDRFAHNCQHFLYSLFELTVTHRDVIDMLEKRVKSRFSQNVIYLPHPKTFEAYVDIIQSVLLGGNELEGGRVEKYVESVTKVFQDKRLSQFLEDRYEESHDPSLVFSIFVEALSCCDLNSAEVDLDLIISNVEEWQGIREEDSLPDLAITEWCVLVAIKRARDKNPDDLVNFDVLYEEYNNGFAASGKTQDGAALARRFSRTVIRAAVDMLIARGILKSARSDLGETIDTREELFAILPLVLLPELLEELVDGESIYHELVDFERELDLKIARKQTNIADAAFKVNKLKRMLKVYISHHAENQAGFGMVTDVDSPPCWTLRVEARLELFGRQGRTQVKPFSHFLKSMVVQLGDGTGPGQLIEWIKNSNTQETDGFEIKRTGTTNTPVRVVLRMDHQPEQFRVSPELAQIIDPESKTKPKIILDIWHYIKEHKLQESDEKKIVQNDETLRRIFGCDKMSFAEIPAKLSPHLLPPLPIELEYFISVDRVEGSAIWEVEVELDDPAKPRQMAPALVAHQRELALLEQKIGEVGSALKASAIHERNLNNFATSPVETMRRLMEAHIEDHEIAMGEPHITTEDLMRAGSFDNEELERAISVFSSAHVRPHPFRL